MPGGPLPQCLWSSRDVDGRAGKGSCRHLPQGHRGKASGKHQIEIWGDGKQTRSFMYIDDCTRGTQAILEIEIHEPINLGSNELVTIDQLVGIAEEIAGIKLERKYDLGAQKE